MDYDLFDFAMLTFFPQPRQDGSKWKDEAIRRWGSKVSSMDVSDWEEYVLSRISKPPPASGTSRCACVLCVATVFTF